MYLTKFRKYLNPTKKYLCTHILFLSPNTMDPMSSIPRTGNLVYFNAACKKDPSLPHFLTCCLILSPFRFKPFLSTSCSFICLFCCLHCLCDSECQLPRRVRKARGHEAVQAQKSSFIMHHSSLGLNPQPLLLQLNPPTVAAYSASEHQQAIIAMWLRLLSDMQLSVTPSYRTRCFSSSFPMAWNTLLSVEVLNVQVVQNSTYHKCQPTVCPVISTT